MQMLKRHYNPFTFSHKLGRFKLGVMVVLLPLAVQARMGNFETTHLKSTAGAGTGSLLLEEATVLNPAAQSFFGVTSLYFQKAGVDKTLNTAAGEYTTDNDQLAVIVSDGNDRISGSVSYINQTEGHDKRKRISLAMGSPLGQTSAFGVAYRNTEDVISEDGSNQHEEKYQQFVAGFTHVISPEVSMGLVVVDPLRKRPNETRAMVGMHYTYKDFIGLMGDMGADYNQNLSDTILYKAAIQFKIMNDFFLRVGTYNDKGLSERGNGAGLAWVQPRLGLELAMKNSKISENTKLNQKNGRTKETSFSLSYRF